MIYCIQMGKSNIFKIGYAKDRDCIKRLKSIQTGNPFPLSIAAKKAGNIKQEKEIHRGLKEAGKNLVGEWFILNETDVYKIFKVYPEIREDRNRYIDPNYENNRQAENYAAKEASYYRNQCYQAKKRLYSMIKETEILERAYLIDESDYKYLSSNTKYTLNLPNYNVNTDWAHLYAFYKNEAIQSMEVFNI